MVIGVQCIQAWFEKVLFPRLPGVGEPNSHTEVLSNAPLVICRATSAAARALVTCLPAMTPEQVEHLAVPLAITSINTLKLTGTTLFELPMLLDAFLARLASCSFTTEQCPTAWDLINTAFSVSGSERSLKSQWAIWRYCNPNERDFVLSRYPNLRRHWDTLCEQRR